MVINAPLRHCARHLIYGFPRFINNAWGGSEKQKRAYSRMRFFFSVYQMCTWNSYTFTVCGTVRIINGADFLTQTPVSESHKMREIARICILVGVIAETSAAAVAAT